MNLEESVDGSSSTTAPADRMLSSLPFRSVSSKKDEKLVRFARATVMLVLFVSGMLVATLAYVVVANSQASSFRLQVRFRHRQRSMTETVCCRVEDLTTLFFMIAV
jgi:hypothetical protein